MRTLWMWALALTGAACAANPPPVPISGPMRDVGALAGEWSGEYRSVETGRSGSIYFKLTAGRDTAYGDVIMVPAEIAGIRGDPRTPMPPAMANISQVLTIRFVRVSGRSITGSIEPYPAPDCECALLTVFRGELNDDRIEGTFTIHHSATQHAEQRGTWWVKRKVLP